MTKSMLQITMLIGVMAAAVLGFTTDVRAQCGGLHCTGKIEELYIHDVVFVGTSGDEKHLACTASGDKHVALRPDERLFREKYDSLLAGLTYNLTMNWLQVLHSSLTSCSVWRNLS
jgi:hypothetical protein